MEFIVDKEAVKFVSLLIASIVLVIVLNFVLGQVDAEASLALMKLNSNTGAEVEIQSTVRAWQIVHVVIMIFGYIVMGTLWIAAYLKALKDVFL